MTRADWQQIAEERLLAAQTLLAANLWASAYYLAGYSVESGLKSCIIVRLAAVPEVLFQEGGNKFSACLVQGPTGEYTMPSGRETLDQIIDQEASFFQEHGKPPSKIRLPVLMAYDLAKCGRDQLGELSGKVFKDGITVFEKEGFHGMSVEIVRDRKATLEFE